MTLRQFLVATRSFPAAAVRSAMAGALAELRPMRLRGRRAHAAFYRAALGRLGRQLDRDLAPARRDAHQGPAPQSPGGDPAAEAVTYRRLAMRVIQFALNDLTAPGCTPVDRESARVFLAGSPMLQHWCSVAALDPRLVTAHATTLREPGSPRAAPRHPGRVVASPTHAA